jgi:hypothetical protein
MLASAMDEEVGAFLEQHAEKTDENGRRLVVRKRAHARAKADHRDRAAADQATADK